jgi:hypothetical protein
MKPKPLRTVTYLIKNVRTLVTELPLKRPFDLTVLYRIRKYVDVRQEYRTITRAVLIVKFRVLKDDINFYYFLHKINIVDRRNYIFRR